MNSDRFKFTSAGKTYSPDRVDMVDNNPSVYESNAAGRYPMTVTFEIITRCKPSDAQQGCIL